MVEFAKKHWKAILASVLGALAAYFAGTQNLAQVIGEIAKSISGMQ